MNHTRTLASLLLIGLFSAGCGKEPAPNTSQDMATNNPDMGEDDGAGDADMSEEVAPDMLADMAVATEEVCDNGVDDNMSGDIDCDDAECSDAPECAPTLCGGDERVSENACAPCDAGSSNDPGDDAAGEDTVCDPILCAEGEFVERNTCEACPAGTENEAGDDASGEDTACAPTLCAEDEFVESNACAPCGVGSSNDSGDDASGEDTGCDPILCAEDEFVERNTCVPCAMGLNNEAGDDATGADTRCEDECSVVVGVYCDDVDFTYIKPFNPQGRTADETENAYGESISVDQGFLAVGDRLEDGDTLSAPGAPNKNLSGSGAVYLYARDMSGAWADAGYLKWEHADQLDLFGASVSLRGDSLAVGIPRDDSATSADRADDTLRDSGAVALYARDAMGAWSVSSFIKADAPAQDDEFGAVVALDGDTLAVTTINSSSRDGSVYLFVRASDGSWSEQAHLTESQPANNARFGHDIALSGDTLVVGTRSEEAYIFQRDAAGTWSEVDHLTPITIQAPYAYGFGQSVGIDGDRIVIGSASDSSNAAGINNPHMGEFIRGSGAAYVYDRVGPTNWALGAFIKPDVLGESYAFGASVDVSGDLIAIGMSGDPSSASGLYGAQSLDTASSNSGAVFLYGIDANGDIFQQAYIKPPVHDAQDRFGGVVALSDGLLAVRALGEDGGGGGAGADALDNSADRAAAVYVLGVSPLTP